MQSKRRMFQGYESAQCDRCGQDYLAWALFGYAEVCGLSSQEAQRLDLTRALPVILEELQVLDAA